ncbi:MAG: DUF3347 domain-containing protein [Chitinophagaceae bacterium]
MKALLIMFIAAISFSACNSDNNKSAESNAGKDTTTTQPSPGNTELKNTGSVNDIVTGYLNLKNALTNDNNKNAAAAANDISSALMKLDTSALTADQKKLYTDLRDDIKEHTEHIGANSGDIAHQREHFDMLSKDMIDLVKATGSSQTLYKDYCPMYNNKKGASWLSESKEIKNPYYGKKMLECGQVKEEIKARG